MKVIFLDVDGVLNKRGTPAVTINGILTMADPELVYRLNLIVDRTDAELVLSSSWRHFPKWEEAMKLSGIVKKFLGCTVRRKDQKPFTFDSPIDEFARGHNIQTWLDSSTVPVDKYAIIDDNADMLPSQLPNFFQTNYEIGLTQEIAEAIEKHLTSPPPNAN